MGTVGEDEASVIQVAAVFRGRLRRNQLSPLNHRLLNLRKFSLFSAEENPARFLRLPPTSMSLLGFTWPLPEQQVDLTLRFRAPHAPAAQSGAAHSQPCLGDRGRGACLWGPAAGPAPHLLS